MQHDFYKQVMANSVQAYLKDIQLNTQSMQNDFYDLVIGNMHANLVLTDIKRKTQIKRAAIKSQKKSRAKKRQ